MFGEAPVRHFHTPQCQQDTVGAATLANSGKHTCLLWSPFSLYYVKTWSHPQNVSHCRHRQTEPRHMYVTCAESPVKFGCVIYEICEWADRQTNRQTYRYATDRWRNKNSTERCRCQLFATSRRQLFRFYLRRRQVTISKSYFLHSFVFIYHHLIIFIIRSRQSKK